MSSYYLKEMIVHVIKANNGISSVQLWLKMAGLDTRFTGQEYHNALDDLIRDGDIIRLVYTDAAASFKTTKQVYFLRGTQFMNLNDFLRTGNDTEETNPSKGIVADKSNPDI